MGTPSDILIILALTVASVAIFRRFSLPPILGYLVVGFVVGPHLGGIIETDSAIELIAELGIAFLLFSIGLEFSLPQVLSMRRSVLGVGSLQVILSALIFAALAASWSDNIHLPVILALALAMSSTAVVTKQLSEQGALHTRSGNVAVGVLLFQDFMAVPALILVTSLSSPETSFIGYSWIAAKSILAVTVLVLFGRYVLPALFREIALARSAELFTLTALLVIFCAAGIAHLLGLPLAMGSFIAGMMLGGSKYRHQIESDIRPFRDVLIGFFFITIGMLANPMVFLDHGFLIIFLAVALIAVKATVIFVSSLLLGYPREVALRSTLILSHVGEFGFAILTLAVSLGVLDQDQISVIFSAAIVTLFAAPLMVNYSKEFVTRMPWSRYFRLKNTHNVRIASRNLHRHCLIFGFGHVGQRVARIMHKYNIPYIILDLDPRRIQEAGQSGEPIFFGNSSDEVVLKALQIKQARLALITYLDHQSAIKTLHLIKRLRPSLPVLVRGNSIDEERQLMAAGALEVIQESLELSLSMGAHALLLSGMDPNEAMDDIRQIRQDNYFLLQAFYKSGEQKEELLMQPLTVDEGSVAIGKKLEDLPFSEYGVEVIAVRRRGIRGDEPTQDLILHQHDVLVVSGTPGGLEQLENAIKAW